MRNIFELTKLEQRVVIVIVTLLVAFALARHFWQKTSEQAPARQGTSPSDWPTRSTSSPTTPSVVHPYDDEQLASPSPQSSP